MGAFYWIRGMLAVRRYVTRTYQVLGRLAVWRGECLYQVVSLFGDSDDAYAMEAHTLCWTVGLILTITYMSAAD